jgi:hypothetical protein
MIKRLILFLFFGVLTSNAQEILSNRIKGLRVNGAAEANVPLTGRSLKPLTIEFDLDETEPANIRLKIWHCDRNWNVTRTSFINDELQNKAKEPISFEPAPAGVLGYRFHYTLQLPGIAGIGRFPQSGNYIFELWDEAYATLLARGRFFVVEKLLAPAMNITNRLLPSGTNPLNQVNKIELAFTVVQPDSDRAEPLYSTAFTVVDVYKNRQLYSPWRIDADDRKTNTFVEGYGTPKLKFIIDNIEPGNEYRQLNIRDVTEYPPGHHFRPRLGADVSRYLQKAPLDNNGVSLLTTGSRYADYLSYQFELLVDPPVYDSIFVVGDFNGWKPGNEFLMKYDQEKERYVLYVSLRRGLYDYQYVVRSHDWTSLESNDWRTVNVYTAFVYYRDQRYGGFDRIVGYAQGFSPGGVEATSH